MELPARGVPNLKVLAQDCWEILAGLGTVNFPQSDRAAPSSVAFFRGVGSRTSSWPGDIWESVAVPTLDFFVGPDPVTAPIRIPTYDEVWARVVYIYGNLP